MRETGKIISLALVAAMVLMGISAMLPMAGAHEYNQTDVNNINILSEDINNYHPDMDLFSNYEIYPGTQNVYLDINIQNGMGGTDGDIYWCNLSINPSVLRDEGGNLITSSYLVWDDRMVDDEATINDGGSNWFNNFQFDVADNAQPGIYNLTVTLEYKAAIDSVSSKSYIGFVLFEVRYRCEIGNIGGLIPGDMNKDVDLNVYFTSASPSWWVEDISIAVTLPDSDFWWFGLTSLTASQTTATTYQDNNFWTPEFMISVSSLKNKGTYTGSYSITYTITGTTRTITESGTVDFVVGDLAMLSVTSTSSTLAQGTSKVTWALSFENVGTVDLLAIECQLDDDSDAFTTMPADHWEDDGTVSYNWLDLGDIDIGETVTVNMEVGIDLYIPEGLHKVMFTFKGKYYDPDTANYRPVEVSWIGGGADGHDPFVNMGGTGYTLTPDSSTVEGPYIWITVTDTALDISLTSQDPLLASQLVDNSLRLDVVNYGNIYYTNVILKIETNSADSPFLNVIDETALFSEETIVGGLRTEDDPRFTGHPTVTLKVTLKAGVTSGVYSVPVTITGVNADMGEAVETTVDARVTITGIGPKLEVTAVAPGEIKNGADFILTLTITNNGDDTARNVVLTMPEIGDSLVSDLNGDLAAPSADALPMYLADIAPGASVDVEVQMIANKDMSSGHVYVMEFAVDYVDSFGYGPSSAQENHYVSLKSSGLGGSVTGQFYYALIILILIVAVFMVVYTVIYVKKYKKAYPKSEAQESYPEAQVNEPVAQAPPPPPSIIE